MTKVNHFSENHQVDDVQWKEKYMYAYYSEKGCTAAGEHQFYRIPLHQFYQWLEDNGHLEVETPKPYLNDADNWENDTYIASIMPEEFKTLDNSYTHPIIREYLLIHYPPKNEFDGITNAIESITSQHKPKS